MAPWRSSLCRESTKVGWPSRERASASSSAAGLLYLECTSNEIGLIAYPAYFVAQASETKRIDGAAIDLQVVSASEHRLAGPDKLIRHRDTIECAVERVSLAFNETWQESKPEILIAPRELCRRGTCLNDFFADGQVAVETIAIDKLRVFVSCIRLENGAPGRRRDVEAVVDFVVCVDLLRRDGRRHQGKQNQNRS